MPENAHFQFKKTRQLDAYFDADNQHVTKSYGNTVAFFISRKM